MMRERQPSRRRPAEGGEQAREFLPHTGAHQDIGPQTALDAGVPAIHLPFKS